MRRLVPGPRISGTSSSAQTLSFLDSVMLNGPSIKKVHINMAGTNMVMSNLTRLTMRADSRPFIDCDPWALRALLGALGKKAEYGTSAVRYTFPLDLFGGAAPAGSLRLDIAKNATPGANQTIDVSYTQGNDTPAGYFMFLANALNIAASASNQPYAFKAPVPGALLMGFAIEDVANITLLRLYAGGQSILEATNYLSLTEKDELERGTTAVAELYLPIQAANYSPNTGYQLELSVGASWAGVANEIVPLWFIPYGQ